MGMDNVYSERQRKKKYLGGYLIHKARFDDKVCQISALRKNIGIVAYQFPTDGIVHHTNNDMISCTVVTITSAEQELIEIMNDMKVKMSDVVSVIQTAAEPMYIRLLELIYIEGMNIDQIIESGRINYSRRHLFTLENKALDSIDLPANERVH